MRIVNISDAKANLSRLLREVQRGERVVIGKAGDPIAVLSAYMPDTSPRKLGGWKGQVRISDGFDNTPDAVTNGFYQSTLTPDDDSEA